jgi:hypothetical protein
MTGDGVNRDDDAKPAVYGRDQFGGIVIDGNVVRRPLISIEQVLFRKVAERSSRAVGILDGGEVVVCLSSRKEAPEKSCVPFVSLNPAREC